MADDELPAVYEEELPMESQWEGMLSKAIAFGDVTLMVISASSSTSQRPKSALKKPSTLDMPHSRSNADMPALAPNIPKSKIMGRQAMAVVMASHPPQNSLKCLIGLVRCVEPLCQLMLLWNPLRNKRFTSEKLPFPKICQGKSIGQTKCFLN